MNTVYAFCRKTDDIVDDDSIPKKIREERLSTWRRNLEISLNGNSEVNLLNQVGRCIHDFNIPIKPFFDLIEGMEIDLKKNRFEDFKELKNYCYKVASTVGLMTIPIFGYKNKKTESYALNLGIALQLTNIIRDIKTDALRGRIYLPLEDLKRFNYSEKDLFDSLYNEEFIKLMKFQTARARSFYKLANKFLNEEDKATMFTARAMQYIYYRLLDKIEHENYNVFKSKIRVSNLNKVIIALMVWFKYKILS